MTVAVPGARHRVFVALPVAPSLGAAALAAMRRALGADAGSFRWLERQALHVTLRFLGEIATPDLTLVLDAARSAAASSAAFSITLVGGGAFPSLGQPRTVWVGVGEGGKQVAGLARSLEEELVARRFPREARAFHAHATVARLRAGESAPDLRGLALRFTGPEAPTAGSQSVDAIAVLESTLLPSGAVYREIGTADLATR